MWVLANSLYLLAWRKTCGPTAYAVVEDKGLLVVNY